MCAGSIGLSAPSSPVAGPVAGIAAFSEVSGGKVCVAAQQFQAKRCQDIEFGASLAGCA
jgi:hypothetical protein